MVPLRVRSHFSLLKGTSSPAALCRRAKRLGYTSLALTDDENLYGLWSFLAACRREKLKPIIGAEAGAGNDGTGRVVMLAEDALGYTNLCKLITKAKSQGCLAVEAEKPEAFQGLFLLVGSAVLLSRLRDSGVSVAADLGSRPTESGSRLRRQARALGIPAVATPDSDMGHDNEIELRRLLCAIESKTVLASDAVAEKNLAHESLQPPGLYRQRFAMWPEVVEQTEMIAERCTFDGPRFGIVMPPWQQRAGVSAAAVLREQAYRGASSRYGSGLSEPVVDRLEHELLVIEQMGFSAYFLVVRDIVLPEQKDGSRKLRRVCGRGSGAASLVAYCLGITNVCPVRHNLYFERFLNPGRSDPPDIDVDFAWDERDAVLAEIFDRFGDCGAMVCNHVFFKPRMAIRETARAYGMPEREISRMTKRLPWFFRRDDESLEDQIAELPSLKDQDFSGPWRTIIELAGRLIGLPRHLSVHPGGVIITPEPVFNYVPVESSPKGVPIIQWEKDSAEEAGLVKIDLLGNRSLGVVRDAVANVRSNNARFHERQWEPERDATTQSAIARGETMGCFYIESPAMRLLQKKAGVGDFEQLVLQSSIIRPAANDFVREYVRRLHGGCWEPLHPCLEEVLEETFGLMVYQEDVSKVAVALAGFSHSKADGLRKVLSKKDRELRLQDYRRDFFEGCRNRGVPENQVEKIWAMMMSFDGYSFCKPHSASYARVSFQAAYLKAHYPAEFMAAVISNQGGYYSTFAYVSEAKRLGLRIDPPDVRCSGYHWQGKDKRLRVGLQAVVHLSRETAEKIVFERSRRAFRTVADFLDRVRPAEDESRALIDAGALDTMLSGSSRSALHWHAAGWHRCGKKTGNSSMFRELSVEAPPLRAADSREQFRREYRALGFLCSAHPLSFFEKACRGTVSAVALSEHVGQSVELLAWLLSGKLVSTKTGEVMEFLTFEDQTGTLEATFFPAVYRRYAHLLTSHRPYRLRGLVEADYGAITLTVERLQPLFLPG